ncbi:hypothetical protein [Demequina litorisediminis]|uniref:Uncharacterized protein n=1 Tax=Demequina litorisediminis TaxID=1849022 RepID=A0ABQ6IJ85_9MICO|nr:hypothetical protein [Demequina litorisediminis]GMA36764.1 hypothetical protein GCM10025876_29680 [Demequina litorisediminis]
MRLAATAAVTTLSATMLAGCSAEGLGDAVGTFARDSAQQAVEDATGGDISLNFGDGATLPADWPDSIPVPEGEPRGRCRHRRGLDHRGHRAVADPDRLCRAGSRTRGSPRAPPAPSATPPARTT